MEKLIITVAGDSRTSYPHNNLCPVQEDIAACAQQYVDAVKAGAAISHIHGRRTLEESIQADGKMVSRIHHADWKKLHHMITEKVDHQSYKLSVDGQGRPGAPYPAPGGTRPRNAG